MNRNDSSLAISVEALCSPLSSYSSSYSLEDSLSLIRAALFLVVPIMALVLDASPSVVDSVPGAELPACCWIWVAKSLFGGFALTIPVGWICVAVSTFDGLSVTIPVDCCNWLSGATEGGN